MVSKSTNLLIYQAKFRIYLYCDGCEGGEPSVEKEIYDMSRDCPVVDPGFVLKVLEKVDFRAKYFFDCPLVSSESSTASLCKGDCSENRPSSFA